MSKQPATWIIVAAMLAVVVLVWARLWAHDERDAMPLLWHVSQAADGRVFVLLGTDLHVELPSGASDGTIDLTRFGVESGVGDFAILSDHRIVLPQGRLPPVTFAENLRVMEGRAVESNMPSELLQLCTRDSDTCSLLAADTEPYRARRTFRMIVDEDIGRLIVADTTRHELALIGMDGRVIDRAGGFSFPNQLQRVGTNAVIVADARNARLVTLEYDADGFDETVEVHRTDCWPGALLRRYPAGVARTDDGTIWATAAMSDMRDAGLYRLAPGAECAEQLDLPPNADPFYLVAIEDSVLAPDSSTYRIHRFALNGEYMDEFGSPALVAELDRLAAQKARLTFIFNNSLWALLLVALPMLLIGNAMRKREQATAGREVGVAPGEDTFDDPETVTDRFDVAEIIRRMSTGQSFRRRFTPLDSDVVLFLAIAIGIAGYLFLAVDIWEAVRSRSTEGISEFLAGSHGFIVFIAVLGAILLAYASAFIRERLVIDRGGIRYESYLGGLLQSLNKLAPDWSLRWDQVASVALKVAGDGRRASEWLYEVRGKDGVVNVFNALDWRSVDAPDGGLWLRDLLIGGADANMGAIARTQLFRTLAPGRKPAGSFSRIASPAAVVPSKSLELVNPPPRYPAAVRRQMVISLFMFATILFVFVFNELAPDYGMPWEWPVIEIVARLWRESPIAVLFMIPVTVGCYLGWKWHPRTLRLDSTGLRMASKIPQPLKNRWTDWTIAREAIESVRIKVGNAKMPVSYFVHIHIGSGKKLLPLFGWYRLDRDIESQATPVGFRFTAEELRLAAERSPLLSALTEYGFRVNW